MRRKRASVPLAAALLVIATSVLNADYAAERATALALGDLTNAPALHDEGGAVTTIAAGELKAVYFDALDYTGAPTRVYAWLGIPDSVPTPMPGMVLVHGGGGTAYRNWVELWNARGYAAISIAVEGQTDSTNPPTINTGWHRHEMAGPVRVGIYHDSAVTLTNQWMCHAVADTVLANSLLRSLPEVDAGKVGLMGISWGGVIASTAMGVDDRFAFAIPTYGCGSLHNASNQYGRALGDNEQYKQVWDPVVRMDRATMPALWLSWPGDAHFPLDCQAATYGAAAGAHMVSLVPGMKHGHGPGWNRPESYAFADSIIGNGTPWCVQQRASTSNGVASATFVSSKPLDRAELIRTADTGVTGDRTWTVTPAALVDNGGGNWTATAALPGETTAWFINALSGELVASSDFREHEPIDPVVHFTRAGGDTNWSSLAEWRWNPGTGWGAAPDYPTSNDTVLLNGGRALAIDTNAAVAGLVVPNAATDASLAVHTPGKTLTVTTLLVGHSTVTGNGTVNQSTGTVSAATVSIGGAGSGTYNLRGGTLELVGTTMNVVSNGLLTIDGGTVTNAAGMAVSGPGKIELKSGTLTINAGAPATGGVTKLNAGIIEVTGGELTVGGQVFVGDGEATEFKVVGDDAAISVAYLNQQPHTGDSGTFHFVFDETGVSTINVVGWMNLTTARIVVDGAAFAGGPGTFTLFDAANLNLLADPANIAVNGLGEEGVGWAIEQDPANGRDWVRLTVLPPRDGSLITIR